MAALVVPDALLITATGVNVGSAWANVYGVALGSPAEIDQDIADDIGAVVRVLYDGFNDVMADEWGLTGVVVADIQAAGNPAFDANIEPLYGTSTGANMPPHAAVCVSHKTARRGKSYRGRTYLSGFTTSTTLASNGMVSGGVQDQLETAYAAFRTNLLAVAGIDAAFAVVSRVLHVATAIVSSNVGAEFDHQDRRKRAE